MFWSGQSKLRVGISFLGHFSFPGKLRNEKPFPWKPGKFREMALVPNRGVWETFFTWLSQLFVSFMATNISVFFMLAQNACKLLQQNVFSFYCLNLFCLNRRHINKLQYINYYFARFQARFHLFLPRVSFLIEGDTLCARAQRKDEIVPGSPYFLAKLQVWICSN